METLIVLVVGLLGLCCYLTYSKEGVEDKLRQARAEVASWANATSDADHNAKYWKREFEEQARGMELSEGLHLSMREGQDLLITQQGHKIMRLIKQLARKKAVRK